MKNIVKIKKAELSTQQIVLLIILIASFLIILFFLIKLNLDNETDIQACHQSVVLRGNKAIPANGIPLNCQTKYLCITEDGTCEGVTKPVLNKVKTKEEIFDILAREMADCWWMFGEGQVNYVGKDMKEKLYCSICTQFVLDDSIASIQGVNNGKINEKDFYEYLENTKRPQSEETYLQYLTGAKNINNLQASINQAGGSFKEYTVTVPYYIMMGIYSKVGAAGWIATGVGVAGAIVAMPFVPVASVSIASALILGFGGTGGYFIGTTVAGESGMDYLTPVIIPANSREFDIFNCKDVMTVS